MPLNTMKIELDRPRKTYQQGEFLSGKIIIENKLDLKHDGIILEAEGNVDLHFNLRTVSLMDTFYGSNKTIPLMHQAHQLKPGGRLEPGITEIPFRIPLDSIGDYGSPLYETYQGVFISIKYFIRCQMKRPLLSKNLLSSTEFMIEYDPNPIGAPILSKQPIKFHITPESLCATKRDIIPDFSIVGQLDSSIFLLTEPVTGDRNYSRDATEVQNIQLGDGNLLRQIPIPIHMILPRLFTCPSLIMSNFRIEFEINLVVIFEDNYLITENFPIKLIRSTLQPVLSS